jgi:hypothetical protein
MRRLFILLLAVIFMAPLCRAEDTCHVSFAMGKVFIEPIALIDVYNGYSLRMGAEFPVSKRLSAIGTVGLYGNGYYFKGGLKRYFKPDNMEDMFLEVNCFYKNNTYDVSDNVRRYDSGSYEAKPGADFSYTVSKRVFGLNLEIGGAKALGEHSHFAVEWFTGLGVRVRTVSPNISDSVQNELYHYHESIIQDLSDSRKENKVSMTLVLGVRVGYCFRRKY